MQQHLTDPSVSFVLWRWSRHLCLQSKIGDTVPLMAVPPYSSPTCSCPTYCPPGLQMAMVPLKWIGYSEFHVTFECSLADPVKFLLCSGAPPCSFLSPASTLFLTDWTPAPSCEEISDRLSGCSRTESRVHFQLCGTSYACRLSLATMLASSTPHNSLQWKCSSESIQSRHISQILQLLPHSLIRSHNPCHRQPESSNGQMQCWYSRVAVLLQASKGQMKSERGDFIKQIFV